MDKLYRSRPSYQRVRLYDHPVLKGIAIVLFCLILMAVGYILGAMLNGFIDGFRT